MCDVEWSVSSHRQKHGQLPEMDRAVLLMRALDEMPYEEIAETPGIPVVAAGVKVHRARLKRMQSRQAWREVVPAAGAKA